MAYFPAACFAVDSRLQPFFSKYCYDCHAGGASEGGLELPSLSSDLSDPVTFDQWEGVFDRVDSKQMPPPDAEQPSEAHRQAFAKLLGSPLERAHAKAKGTVLRRLNRSEYTNTLNDIFGVDLDLATMLPEDSRSHEFDNVGDALNISMVQLQRYLEGIDTVIDAAIAKTTVQPVSTVVTASYADMDGAEKFIGNQWLKLPDGAVVFFKQYGYPTGLLKQANAKTTGRHKIRVTGYTYQSQVPITFSIGSTSYAPGSDRPTFGYYKMPPLGPSNKPTTIELEAWLEQRHMIEITPWGLHDPKNQVKSLGVEKYQGAGLAIVSVELTGPMFDEFPTRGHKLVYSGLDRQEIEPKHPSDKTRSKYMPRFEVVSQDQDQDASKVLSRVATKAFRRPVSPSDTAIYRDLFSNELKQGATFDEALRTAIAAIFCSPDFLYLQEPAGKLNDYALAARLSYFLTRSTPDDELLTTADTKRLTADPAALLQQTERLLADPRSERFVIDFTDAWLNLRDIEFTSPDQNLFPEFDQYLQYSMLAETRAYFRKLFTENLPIENLVKSDFAMLNERLAELYEIDNVSGPEIRAVSLPQNSVRGGLLSQASVLKVSANGTNTSPVVRGVYVTERILGVTPDPPPPGIPGVEPDIRGATTLRQLLDKHRDNDNCRACHAMIDPPGFALENFNPIGGWSEQFRSLGDGNRVNLEVDGRKVRYKQGPDVDATGQLADGRKFNDFNEFRQLICTDKALLTRAFTIKLLTFATGRELGFSDRREIMQIVDESAKTGYRIGDLLKLVVASEIFKTK